MLKMQNAYTREIDDVEAAVAEVLAQLDFDALGAHRAGLLSCYSEFVDSGVVAALCAALPFDVVGCTTLGNATNDSADMMQLCLSVLSGDGAAFAAVMSGSLAEGVEAPVAEAYRAAERALGGQPKLLFGFYPMIRNVGGEVILKALGEASGGVPVFGIVASDQESGSEQACTLLNGESSTTALALLAVGGDVAADFYVASVSEQRVQRQKSIITRSAGNMLIEVNGMPVMDFIRSLGLAQGDGIEGMNTIPFLLDYGDGAPGAARAIYRVTEEGYASCAGDMPEGARLSIGSIDAEDVLCTAEAVVRSALEKPRGGLIMMPCLSRNLVLGTDVLREMEKVRAVAGGVPFHFCYSGGESCPVYDEAGAPVNRFHNFSFTVCALS